MACRVRQKKGRIVFRRLVSACLLFVFIVSQLFTHPSYAGNAGEISRSNRQGLPASPQEIVVPRKLGKILETYRGSENKTVVLIQDAHAVPEAQRNIRKLIDYFQKRYGLKIVSAEGAASRLDLQIFRSFPDKNLLGQVIGRYLDEGEMTGLTAAAALNRESGFYAGIEDWPLYLEGLGFYLRAMALEKGFEKNIAIAREKLRAQKEKIYSPQLLAIDRGLEVFWGRHGDWADILKKLSAVKRPETGSDLEAVLGQIESGQEIQNAFKDELSRAADDIKKALDSKSPALRRGFNRMFQEFRTSRIRPEVFALYLRETGAKVGTPAVFSEEVLRRLEQQKRIRDIEGPRFFAAFQRYARSVKSVLFRNGQDRDLDQRSRRLILLEKLARLELTREEWEALKTEIQDSRSERQEKKQAWEARLKTPFAQSKYKQPAQDIGDFISSAGAFYRNAEKREQVFFEKLRKLLSPSSVISSPPTAVLFVAGGFHTEGLARMLRAQGISYLLVNPSIRAIPENTRYRDCLRGNVSWEGYFKEADGKIDLYGAFVRGVRDRLVFGDRVPCLVTRNTRTKEQNKNGLAGLERSDVILTGDDRVANHEPRVTLKAWRDQILRDLAVEGRISEGFKYVSFLDEIAGEDALEDDRPEWSIKVARLIEDLEKLEIRGQWNETSIAGAFAPSTLLQAAGGNASASPGSFLPSRYFPGLSMPEARKRSELRSPQAGEDWQAKLSVMARDLAGSMNAAERKVTRIQDLWGLMRDLSGVTQRGGVPQEAVTRGTLQRYEADLKSYFRSLGFAEEFTDPFLPSEIYEGLREVERRTPAFSRDLLQNQARKNHTLSVMLGPFRVRLPVEYSRHPTLRFVRYGRPSEIGLLMDTAHPGNYVAFQVVDKALWMAHGSETILRQVAESGQSGKGPEEISVMEDEAIKRLDRQLQMPKKSETLKRHHSFGFAGFSVYISADKEQTFSIEREGGKSYREGNQKTVTISANAAGGAAEIVLRLQSHRQNVFSIDGVGWRYPGAQDVYPLMIGRNPMEDGKNALNLNRIVDMIRTGELEENLAKSEGKLLVLDPARLILSRIPRPEYEAGDAGGRRVKISVYHLEDYPEDPNNPIRLYYSGTIKGHPWIIEKEKDAGGEPRRELREAQPEFALSEKIRRSEAADGDDFPAVEETAQRVVDYSRRSKAPLPPDLIPSVVARLPAVFLQALREQFRKQVELDEIDAQSGFLSLLRDIREPAVIRQVIGEGEWAVMSPAARGRWVSVMAGAVRSNPLIAVRFQIPQSAEKFVSRLAALEKKSKIDPLRLLPAPGGDYILFNVRRPENAPLFSAEPVLTIGEPLCEGVEMLDPRYYAGKTAMVSPENLAEVFTGGLLLAAARLKNETAQMITQDPSTVFVHYLSSPAVLGTLGRIGQWLVSTRSLEKSA
jgi:hypothetical protein